MRTPAIILLLFILASFTIIFLSRPIKIRPKTLEERIERSIPTTKVTWIDSLQNLGKVIEGNSITVQFRFKNSGTRMLVISDVAASCGCTIPEKPEKPISPDSVGVIKAIFNSKNRVGLNHKKLYAFVNTEKRIQELIFDVEVIPAK